MTNYNLATIQNEIIAYLREVKYEQLMRQYAMNKAL